MAHDFEWYPTPKAFTSFLVREMRRRGWPLVGSMYAPCVGDGAIVKAIQSLEPGKTQWFTNDLDFRWKADAHMDATKSEGWPRHYDWIIDNPPFSELLPIIQLALQYCQVGVAMHLRMSFNEPTIERREFLRQYPPTGLLFLPRFSYRRSPNGKQLWSTDNVGAVWAIWIPGVSSEEGQFIGYADAQCCAEAKSEAPDYRRYMDAMSGHATSKD